VIAVNISSQPEMQSAATTLDMLLQTFAIMGQSINRFELKEADVVIQPSLGAMKGNDFNSRNLAVLSGEQAAMAAMAEITQKLQERRAP
jgi:NTE family protein